MNKNGTTTFYKDRIYVGDTTAAPEVMHYQELWIEVGSFYNREGKKRSLIKLCGLYNIPSPYPVVLLSEAYADEADLTKLRLKLETYLKIQLAFLKAEPKTPYPKVAELANEHLEAVAKVATKCRDYVLIAPPGYEDKQYIKGFIVLYDVNRSYYLVLQTDVQETFESSYNKIKDYVIPLRIKHSSTKELSELLNEGVVAVKYKPYQEWVNEQRSTTNV